jgi:hypothetical protein
MSSSTSSFLRHEQQEAGGRVGRGRHEHADHVLGGARLDLADVESEVWKHKLQMPLRGYSTSSTRLKEVLLSANRVSATCLAPE